MALIGAAPSADYSELTLAQTADRLHDAVEYAQLTAQQGAAPNDPIFAAISRAQAVEDDVRSMIPWFSSGGLAAPAETFARASKAIEDLNAAAANMRRAAPDAPLPTTNWASILPTGVPWPWLAVGGGLVLATAVLFRRRQRRRR